MDNRSIIAEQALALFATRGYDAVGVQEICEAAAITKPTLYHYFGSKRGLLESILSESFSRMNGEILTAAKYEGDLPLTLQRIAEVCFNFAGKNPVFYRLQLGLWFSPRESEGFLVVSRLNRFQYEIIERLFIEAVPQHGNMRGRHQAYAITFLGMVNNYIGLGLNGLTKLDSTLVKQAVHQFQHGIYS